MIDIIDFSEKDAGAMYGWLKNVIISSRYIIPGADAFREIKIKRSKSYLFVSTFFVFARN